MPRRTVIFLVFLTVVALLLGYNYFAQPFAQPTTQEQVMQQSTPTPEPTSEEDEAAEMLRTLSAEDKVMRLLAFPLNLDSPESTRAADIAWINDHQPGVVVLFGDQIATIAAQAAVTAVRSQPRDSLQQQSPLIAVDHEGGEVQRLSGTGFTRLPSWRSVCAQSQEERQELLQLSLHEVREVGVNIIFAPVVDLATASSQLSNRTCSVDPDIVTTRSSEMINAIRQEDMLPVIKHFPGIGSVKVDLHQQFGEVKVQQQDVQVFQNLLDTYPAIGVMTAHVGVASANLNEPCSLSSSCLQDLVRNYPSALVFTDALDMSAAGGREGNESLADRSQAAFKAGNDVLMFGPAVTAQEIEQVVQELVRQVSQDEKLEQQIDLAVQKMYQYQQLLQP